VPADVMLDAIASVSPEPAAFEAAAVRRGGLAATRALVDVADSSTHRTWTDVATLLDRAPLDDTVRGRARATFERLATAEAEVHGIDVADVHFHEVGALDAIADIVGVCAGFAHLGLTQLVVSPVAVGSGRVHTAHGSLPVPVPAVAALLRGAPTYAGPGTGEACTPTGAALLRTWATGFGPQPAMAVGTVGVGAGGRDPDTHANVVRLLLGTPSDGGAAQPTAVVLETNVDDLDPRLWPDVIAALIAAGASDAWLTPILMKKGRPAHTLSVLAPPDRLDTLRRVVFEQTSTIGVRETAYAKTALEREVRTVPVDGHPVRVKVASLDGEVMNVQPEYDDVVAAARASGRPVKDVLAAANSAARRL
jgi:uncharacterized protein (TIGR00299 family) protein